MIKRNGQYFLITSGMTGWRFNESNYYRAANIAGPYTDMGDPCVGAMTETTFNSQGTVAFPVEGNRDDSPLPLRAAQHRPHDRQLVPLPADSLSVADDDP